VKCLLALTGLFHQPAAQGCGSVDLSMDSESQVLGKQHQF